LSATDQTTEPMVSVHSACAAPAIAMAAAVKADAYGLGMLPVAPGIAVAISVMKAMFTVW